MTTTTYLWDSVSDNILSEDDGTSTTTYTNEPTEFGDLVSQGHSGDTNFYHFDARGDTRELTDTSQIVTDTRTYDAWGNVLQSSGSIPTQFQFVGKLGYIFDSIIQRHYVRARWYEPRLARWKSVDPLFYTSESEYGYADSSPLTGVDPSGALTWESAPLTLGKWGMFRWPVTFIPENGEREGWIIQEVTFLFRYLKCGGVRT